MMKFSGIMFGLLLLTTPLLSAKDKESSGQVVDSGSFGVYLNAQRVSTETFTIHQGSVSTISAQVKEDAGPSSQSCELQVSPTGALVRYEWKELAPGKSTLLVVPKDEFVVETVTEKPGDKPIEQPFLLPTTSPVVDNNFFIHRQVLIWRYLTSASCSTEAGQLKCGTGEFGILIPQARTSSHLTIQPAGDEKVIIRGAERTLFRLNLKADDGEWALWLDAHDRYKVIRITKTGVPVEVLRD